MADFFPLELILKEFWGEKLISGFWHVSLTFFLSIVTMVTLFTQFLIE